MFLKLCILLIISTFLVTTNTMDLETSGERSVRSAKPAGGILGFFQTILDMKRLYDQQYNDTTTSLRQVLNIINDGFTDTATKKPQQLQPMVGVGSNETVSSTTERYRISRAEFGRILGRNFRGLQKLLRLELADAKNQSAINAKEYRGELANALTPYSIIKNNTISGKS